MNARDGEPDPAIDVEVERALAHAPRPVARAGFQRQLRERFLAVEAGTRAVAGDGSTLRSYGRGPGTRAARDDAAETLPPRRRIMKLVALGAAAAVLLLIFALRPRPAQWSVVDRGGVGTTLVRIDGAEHSVGDRARFEDALATASAVETTESALTLQLGDLFLIELAPRSRIGLPERTSRPESLAVQTERGAVRICTGPGFAGSQMRMITSDLDLRVTGTAFAVDLLEPDRGTCVCCIGGKVEVHASSLSEMKMVPEGRMCVIWREKAMQPKWAPVSDVHVDPLRELEAFARTIWPR